MNEIMIWPEAVITPALEEILWDLLLADESMGAVVQTPLILRSVDRPWDRIFPIPVDQNEPPIQAKDASVNSLVETR
jgi:hypothetical protein